MENDLKSFEILINENRSVYTNHHYDITIIEIKKEDMLIEDSFFDVDRNIFKGTENFIKKPIYLLHYPKGIGMNFSNGIIKRINEDNYTINHTCDSNEGSSGASIINSNNFKVIGIHKGGAKGAKNYNLGTFLRQSIFYSSIILSYENFIFSK